MNSILKRLLPHLIAIAIFLGLSLAYFSPVLDGYVLKQGDINKHKAMAKEVMDYRDVYDGEPLWTNSMFGGMPATQISVKYRYDVLKWVDAFLSFGLPHPVNYLFLYMLGFYILLILFKADPWIAIAGAVAYGFSSYLFIILGAGHNSKAHAVAYMAPTIAAIILTLRGKLLLGGALSALFLALQLRANHIQITYYMMIIVGGIFVVYAIDYLRKKEFKTLGLACGTLLAAFLLALLTNTPNLYGTYEYSRHTIRGGSELSIQADSSKVENKEGLDLGYITSWSYGIEETFTLLIPNTKGGATGQVKSDEELMELASESDAPMELKQKLADSNQYWGNQTFTSGPVYIGAIVCFLFFMALIFMSGPLKWSMIVVSLLALALSWGKNFMSLTEFFVNNIPMYNKFRAVTIVLVIIEFTLPVLGFLWLRDLIKNKEGWTEKYEIFGKVTKFTKEKVFLIGSGVIAFIMILMIASPGTFFTFTSDQEQLQSNVDHNKETLRTYIAQNPDVLPADVRSNPQEVEQIINQQAQLMADEFIKFKPVLVDFREEVFKKDALRSLIFVILTAALIFAFMKMRFDSRIFAGVLAVLIIADLWPVAMRYLNNEEPMAGPGEYQFWQENPDKLMPYLASEADKAIIESEIKADPELAQQVQQYVSKRIGESDSKKKWEERLRFGAVNFNTNYRVLNATSRLDQDGVTPYFHKSIGGYHGAKLQRFQDLISFYLERERSRAFNPNSLASAKVLNMLNTKYIITNPERRSVLDLEDPTTYSNQFGVIKNPHAMGNAWFVKGVRYVNDANEEILALKNLNIQDSIVVDKKFQGELNGWSPASNMEGAQIELESYLPNHLVYKVSGVNQDMLAVFSEIYYPIGWQMYIDGKKASHFRANYVLRAAKIPAGTKSVEFKYELASYGWSTTASLAGSILILLILGFVVYKEVIPSLRGQD